jgi:hypothetical protein
MFTALCELYTLRCFFAELCSLLGNKMDNFLRSYFPVAFTVNLVLFIINKILNPVLSKILETQEMHVWILLFWLMVRSSERVL